MKLGDFINHLQELEKSHGKNIEVKSWRYDHWTSLGIMLVSASFSKEDIKFIGKNGEEFLMIDPEGEKDK